MKQMFLKYILIIAQILTLVCYSFSQDNNDRDRKQYYDIGKKLYTDYLILPASYPDSIKTIIMFRYTYDLLVFSKSNPKNLTKGEFFAPRTFEIEFKDENGIIRSREILSDTLYVKSYEEAKSKTEYLFDAAETTLPLNNYTVLLRFNGQNVQSSQTKLLTKINNLNYFYIII